MGHTGPNALCISRVTRVVTRVDMDLDANQAYQIGKVGQRLMHSIKAVLCTSIKVREVTWKIVDSKSATGVMNR